MEDISKDVKILTYLGAEKTALATMETGELAKFVDKWVKEKIRAADRKGANGLPTISANHAADDLNAYIDEQMEMFASRGMNKHRAYKEAVVPTGVYFTNRFGEQVEQYRIIVRETSLEPVEKDDAHNASVVASRSYSQGLGFDREAKRGKYNDAGLLIEQSSASVDPSEVVPFAQATM